MSGPGQGGEGWVGAAALGFLLESQAPQSGLLPLTSRPEGSGQGEVQGTEPVGVQTPWVSQAPRSPELTPWPWAAFRQPFLELSMRLPLPPRLCPWRKLVVIFSRHHNEIDRTSFYPFKIC